VKAVRVVSPQASHKRPDVGIPSHYSQYPTHTYLEQ
jgi:hypothetical protein